MTYQKDHQGEGGGEVKVQDVEKPIELPATSTSLPQLQRIRRQFIAMNRQHSLSKARVKEVFVDYLNSEFMR
jgi:protein KTI12